jgi:hypothetical protein
VAPVRENFSIQVPLKGVWHEIFDLRFFSWISVPQAHKYSIGPFWIFSKIRRDIRELMFIPGVNDTGCSATAATNYPSLRNLPNGCQGHPRPCLSPPDRPPITEPDSNDVLTRSNFYSTIGIGWHKMHKAVEAWKQKKIRINNMYTLHIFLQYGIYFQHELAYTLHYIKLNSTKSYAALPLTFF